MKREIPNEIKMIDNPSLFEGFIDLSDREKNYFRMMFSQSGVLYITSEPGIAKSAIMRSIARKLGLQYFDIRLSMVDETDVGLFPIVDSITMEDFNEIDPFGQGIVDSFDPSTKKIVTPNKVNNNGEIKTLRHVVPEWAIRAANKPSIIHFEELNRSTLQVRNAALQLLLEREIGAFFKFNKGVFMVCSGNLGEEDGTDVEEFDQALNNRLIHYRHTMDYPEWREQFANENVHPIIVGFLRGNTQHYYKKPNEKNQKFKAYATPRSWTFLSDYIFANYGEWIDEKHPHGHKQAGKVTGKKIRNFPNPRIWIDDISKFGHAYVGASNLSFMKYVRDALKISLVDILDRFDEIEDDVKNFTRDKTSEILSNMKERKIIDLKVPQIKNLIKFLITVSEDEEIGYLLHVLDSEYNLSDNSKENKAAENFLSAKEFIKYRDIIYGHVDDDDDDEDENK